MYCDPLDIPLRDQIAAMTNGPNHAILRLCSSSPVNTVMTEQAERIPVAEDYLRALGRATYNFAYLEWGIIWITETLQFGFLEKASNMTAGQIADNFLKAVEGLDDTEPDKAPLQALATNFVQIVADRNRLMHGNPHTAQTGEQRILYDGRHGRTDWTIDSITQFSSHAATASIEAGDLLHNGRLQQYHAAHS